VILTDEQIDAAERAYADKAVPAWTSNRHRPALVAAILAAIAETQRSSHTAGSDEQKGKGVGS
jgi:hypothetical protein